MKNKENKEKNLNPKRKKVGRGSFKKRSQIRGSVKDSEEKKAPVIKNEKKFNFYFIIFSQTFVLNRERKRNKTAKSAVLFLLFLHQYSGVICSV